jgi:hypothetical protein
MQCAEGFIGAICERKTFGKIQAANRITLRLGIWKVEAPKVVNKNLGPAGTNWTNACTVNPPAVRILDAPTFPFALQPNETCTSFVRKTANMKPSE